MEEVKIIEIETNPVPAPTYAELLSTTEDDIILPASPYYNYPFKPAASLPEYIVYRVLMNWELAKEYDGKKYEYIEDELKEAAKLLGKRYVIYLTEGGNDFDRVVFTNRKELVDEALLLAKKLEDIEKEYESKGLDPYDYVEDIIEKLSS